MSRDRIKEVVRIARDLQYSRLTIKKLKAAKSESEISRILYEARMAM